MHQAILLGTQSLDHKHDCTGPHWMEISLSHMLSNEWFVHPSRCRNQSPFSWTLLVGVSHVEVGKTCPPSSGIAAAHSVHVTVDLHCRPIGTPDLVVTRGHFWVIFSNLLARSRCRTVLLKCTVNARLDLLSNFCHGAVMVTDSLAVWLKGQHRTIPATQEWCYKPSQSAR